MTTQQIAGTTNAERAFEPGDIILWANEEFEVLDNEGHGGNVRSLEDGSHWFYYWYLDGDHCRLVLPKP